MAAPRLVRYRLGDAVHHGRLDGDTLIRLDGPPWLGGRETGDRDARGAATLQAPVTPSKIVCVGLNYRAHIAESATVLPDAAAEPREPLLFFKPPSAVIGPDDAIVHPPGVERLDPEAELAVVIGRRATRVLERDAMDHVFGLTAFNDVSARNYQRSDGQWARAKGFDTFAPTGPWIVAGLDPAAIEVTCRVNGETRQHGRTADLLFAVPRLIAFVSGIMTLEPGDVIATGTPAGVAPIVPGDVVEVEVSGVGVLRNPVIRREDA
jgi:2-keto-4-pentenoate hydratase/2-oxohepta-3-ene-1,7-dioic acid hydratase in catechol pathway